MLVTLTSCPYARGSVLDPETQTRFRLGVEVEVDDPTIRGRLEGLADMGYQFTFGADAPSPSAPAPAPAEPVPAADPTASPPQ
jgi:hypothetical protein